MEDSTANVERKHSVGTYINKAHKGPLSENGVTYSDLLECKLDGVELSEVAERVEGMSEVTLAMTDFSRDFLTEWRQKHGARFRVYGAGKRKRAKESEEVKIKKVTLAGLHLRQQAALRKRGGETSAPSTRRETVIPGLSEAEAAAAFRQKPRVLTKGLASFAQRTRLLKQKAQAVNVRRRCNERSYKKPDERRAKLFTPADAADPGKEWLRRFMLVKRWKVLDATVSDASKLLMPHDKDDVRLVKLSEFGSSEQALDFARQCHVAIVDSTTDLLLAAPSVAKNLAPAFISLLKIDLGIMLGALGPK